MVAIKVNLVSIGNSKGVRIPASVIKECGLGGELELRVENGVIVLAPVRGVRAGWYQTFERMAVAGDDAAMIPDMPDSAFHAEGWTW